MVLYVMALGSFLIKTMHSSEKYLSESLRFMTVPRWYFFWGSFAFFMSCVCHAFASIPCCLVVN